MDPLRIHGISHRERPIRGHHDMDTSGHDMGGGDVDGVLITASQPLSYSTSAISRYSLSASVPSASLRGISVLRTRTNVAGVGGAIVMFLVGVYFFRMIRKQEGNSITSNTNLVGKTVIVTVSIPSNGYGEIKYTEYFGRSNKSDRENGGHCNRTRVGSTHHRCIGQHRNRQPRTA